ncbi:MAG: hypothetical protein ACRDOO_05145 [Actinomadura sp.]
MKVFVVSAVLSLVLSPITAIYAVLIGTVGFCTAMLIGRVRTPSAPAMALAGIAVGSLPYLIAGLVP